MADGGNAFLASKKEDIRLYQYWYSKATIDAIVAECLDHASRVAFLSTPSIYFSLCEGEAKKNGRDVKKEMVADSKEYVEAEKRQKRAQAIFKASRLFDYDKSFDSAEGYVFYNYKEPEKIPEEHWHKFDFVVIDPPSVRDDVLALYARAARILLPKAEQTNTCQLCWFGRQKPKPIGVKPPSSKILISSLAGDSHSKLMHSLFGAKPCVFLPTIPNLIYQYHLYTNYDSVRLSQPNPDQPEPDPKKTSARSRLADFGVKK